MAGLAGRRSLANVYVDISGRFLFYAPTGPHLYKRAGGHGPPPESRFIAGAYGRFLFSVPFLGELKIKMKN